MSELDKIQFIGDVYRSCANEDQLQITIEWAKRVIPNIMKDLEPCVQEWILLMNRSSEL